MGIANKLTFVGAAAAAALALAPDAMAQSAAERAVQEAQKYKGTEITIVWEAGLQSLDPLNFSGPKWEELTGIHVNVVEVPTEEMFTKIMQDYRGGDCFYATVTSATDKAIEIEGFGTTVAPFASVMSSRHSIAVMRLGVECSRYGRSRCQTNALLTRGALMIAL